MANSNTFTHSSYEAANKAARKNEGVVCTSDAGNGWTHWVVCQNGQLRHWSTNPEGLVIV